MYPAARRFEGSIEGIIHPVCAVSGIVLQPSCSVHARCRQPARPRSGRGRSRRGGAWRWSIYLDVLAPRRVKRRDEYSLSLLRSRDDIITHVPRGPARWLPASNAQRRRARRSVGRASRGLRAVEKLTGYAPRHRMPATRPGYGVGYAVTSRTAHTSRARRSSTSI